MHIPELTMSEECCKVLDVVCSLYPDYQCGEYYFQIPDTDEETVRKEIQQELKRRKIDVDMNVYTNISLTPEEDIMIKIVY